MKKLFVLVSILLITSTLFAQKDKIAGSWLMVKADLQGKIEEPFIVVEYSASGKIIMMDVEFGSWSYDKSKNTLTVKSQEAEFNGVSKIVKLTDSEMILEKDKIKFFYQKLDISNAEANNKKSNLEGVWKISSEYNEYAKFELPNTLKLVSDEDGSITTLSGNWYYNSSDNSIILISINNPFKGKSIIEFNSTDKFTLENGGNSKTFNRVKLENFEKLTYTENEFSEEVDQSKLPWVKDIEDLAIPIKDIKYLKYNRGVLQNNLGVMFNSSVLVKVTVNMQKPSINFKYLTISKNDSSQFAEYNRANLMNSYNFFFPMDEPYPYRVVGKEEITVNAGSFMCTVVEGFDSDKKIKLWMIDNLPGVYAKYITEQESYFDENEVEYTLWELMEIGK